MSAPETPPSGRAGAGALLVVWLMVSFVGIAWGGSAAWTVFYVEPDCRAACEALGAPYESLWIGGRGRGETACVCGGDVRVPTSAPDVGTGLAVFLGLAVAYGSTALFARRGAR